ncbi:MAG: hypothetical protein LBC02_13115 [Planctomycetaceae bacterium]|jgi:hypothetical protein|nr:hypothetical protein [Planctomycetaceae bacterium]
MELQKHSEDEGERHIFRQVEVVIALRFVPACHVGVTELRARRPCSYKKNLLPFKV